jgi:two-component system, NtrC family, nitrogen regulation response regulator NtrX
MPHAYATYVLIVDDDPDIRCLLRDVLEDEGYDVREAADGLAAWETLCAVDAPAVVIIDHNMPNLDGPGLMKRMVGDSAIASRVAVIYSTAAMHGATPHSIAPALERLLEALSASLLWKPFDVDDLLQTVSEAASHLTAHDEQASSAHAWN